MLMSSRGSLPLEVFVPGTVDVMFGTIHCDISGGGRTSANPCVQSWFLRSLLLMSLRNNVAREPDICLLKENAPTDFPKLACRSSK